jgi:hypothetical protein
MDARSITSFLLVWTLAVAPACDDPSPAPADDDDADTVLVPTDLGLLDAPDLSPETHTPDVPNETSPEDSAGPLDTDDTDDTDDTSSPDTSSPDTPSTDTTSSPDTEPPDTSSPDTTDPDTSISETLDSRDTRPPDPDPCELGPDTDGDGLVDACDGCPQIPWILLYDLHSDRQLARRAIEHLGCEHTVAGIADFTTLLESGDFDLVVMDLPDARPEGPWTAALLDHITQGGAAIVGGQRLNLAPSPSLPATLGASWGSERQTPVSFTPTWTVPLYASPNALRQAGFAPDTASPWTWNGAPLTPTAGRVWARAADGSALIVESNGGRTFINGFVFDDYPYDTDFDGVPDLVELLANQLAHTARHLTPPSSGPTIDGIPTRETFRHELPILRGTTPVDTSEVAVHRGPATHRFPVSDRRFKALTQLSPGENWVTLEATRDGRPTYTHLELDYQPQTNPRKVRLVYAIASDGDGRFDAPFGEPNDLASAKRRLIFSGRLMQSMMADRMRQANLGQHTFELVRDPSHTPEVHVWRTSASTAQWHAMDGLQMWSWIWGHMNELPSCTDCKTIIVLGMTRYDAANNRALAHTALGGGGVALFGSGTLHTFAEDLDQLVDRLEDTRDVTTLQPPLFDDSGFRKTMWANYATGLGAILHELAHAFDLPHAVDTLEIVNRGFDHVNRLVMSREPAHAYSAGLPLVLPQHEPIFAMPNLGRLRWHRFNALDNRAYTVNTRPQASIVGQEVRINAPGGLRVIGYARDIDNDWKMVTGTLLTGQSPPTTYTIPKSSIRLIFPNESRVRLYLSDDQGNLDESLIIPLP